MVLYILFEINISYKEKDDRKIGLLASTEPRLNFPPLPEFSRKRSSQGGWQSSSPSFSISEENPELPWALEPPPGCKVSGKL